MPRIIEPELLDQAPPADATENLRDLAKVNRWLGGNRVLVSLLRPYLLEKPNATVLDVGGADGATARWLSRRFPQANFVTADRSARFLQGGSGRRVAADALQLPFAPGSFDIVMCTLFLHHFENEEVARILRSFERTARRAVLAVDLQRHLMADYFLPLTKPLFGWHPLSIHDGRISVRAAFTASELRAVAPWAEVRTHFPWFRLSVRIDKKSGS